jgi:imidazolonepropionase-like amidohydrolase
MIATAPAVGRHTAVIAIAVLLALSGCSEKQPVGTAITNVTVIDAVNGVRSNHTVIFDGDEIIAVAPASKAPEANESIDGTGLYLIPGLWDMHVHLTYDDRFTESMPAGFLSWGITSVRDTGGLMHKLLPVVEKMRAPGAIAPRVYFSGPLLDGRHVVYDGDSRPEIGTRNASSEMAETNVANLKQQGVDFIKIYELVSPEVFDTLVSEAEKHGLPIASHVPLSMIASEAGPQVGSMEHLRNVELDCAANSKELHRTRQQVLESYEPGSGYELRSSLHSLQRLAAIAVLDEKRCARVLSALTETIQVPTARLNAAQLAPVFERDDWLSALSAMPQDVQDEWSLAPDWLLDENQRDTRFAIYTLEMISRMKAAGVPIGAGTDTPMGRAIPGYSLHNELDLLVRAGLTPLEAIEAATVRPAEFLSLQDEMGTIDVGKRADLVLLTENPLDDITHTRSIGLVISKGQIVSGAMQ